MSNIFCRKCGANLEHDSQYCHVCGSKVVLVNSQGSIDEYSSYLPDGSTLPVVAEKNEFEKEQENIETIKSEIESLRDLGETLLAAPEKIPINSYLRKLTVVSSLLKKSMISSDIKYNLRRELFLVANNVALKVNKDCNLPDFAYLITDLLSKEYFDTPGISEVARSLSHEYANMFIQKLKEEEEKSKSNNWIWYIGIAAFAILVIFLMTLFD